MEAGAWSVRTGSPYQAGPIGPQIRAPLGACPPQASLCSPPALEAQRRQRKPRPSPTAASIQIPSQPLPAQGSVGCASPEWGSPQVQDSLAPYRHQQAEARTAILGLGGRVWVVQTQGHLPATQREGSRCHVHLTMAWGLAALITGAKNGTGGLGEGVTSLGRRIPRLARPSHPSLLSPAHRALSTQGPGNKPLV